MRAKQVEFDVTYVNLRDKPDWFLDISPHGKVPVLKVDDEILFESNAIAEFLDEMVEPKLHPADPIKRARNRAWTDFVPDFSKAINGIGYAKTREAMDALKDSAWEIPLPIVVLGGIYSGFLVVSEAAAVTAVYVVLVEVLIRREVSFGKLMQVVRESTMLVGAILIILGVSLASTNYIIDAEIPTKLFEWISQRVSSAETFIGSNALSTSGRLTIRARNGLVRIGDASAPDQIQSGFYTRPPKSREEEEEDPTEPDATP